MTIPAASCRSLVPKHITLRGLVRSAATPMSGDLTPTIAMARAEGNAFGAMSMRSAAVDRLSGVDWPPPIADGFALRGQNRTSRPLRHHRMPLRIIAIAHRRDVSRRFSDRLAPSRPTASRPIPMVAELPRTASGHAAVFSLEASTTPARAAASQTRTPARRGGHRTILISAYRWQ
jgi:hypothetical protein